MTALSLTAPRQLRTAMPQRHRRAAASAPKAPVSRGARPAGLAAGRAASTSSARRFRPVANPECARRSEGRPLRLTRRGRLLITTLLFALGVAITLFSGTVSLAGTHAEHASVRYVTVAPGDTLWSIAGEAAPGVDRRDTVYRIVELNALAGPELSVGQQVAVPANG